MRKFLKKVVKFLFSRLFICCAIMLVQLVIILGCNLILSKNYWFIHTVFILLSVIATLWIVSKWDNPSFKLAWIIPILLFPVFGGLLYLLFGKATLSSSFRKKLAVAQRESETLLIQDENVNNALLQQDLVSAKQSRYIQNSSLFPVYQNTLCKYLSPGEEFGRALLLALKNAKHTIFMEHFIVSEGKFFAAILEVLRQKASEGVDVRFMYDDMGCIGTLPYKFDEKLRQMGINCGVFNPFKPSLNILHNNRDHRKIAIIDSYIAFTGGNNLADEYVNLIERFGHWKDASVMLQGEAVWNLTVMFLQSWDLFNPAVREDVNNLRPHTYHPEPFPSDGFIQPFGDSPLDDENVSELAYMNIIHQAQNYVYITTPYLIVDNEMIVSLVLAAKSGVDVRIITPAVYDKWYVHMVTRAYYPPLIKAGVKIYEYTPGFIHSKMFISDDKIGILGTCNMDFRSFYMHFECGVWMYKSSQLAIMKEDFLRTLEVCQPITMEDCKKVKWPIRVLRSFLRLFAPLM